MRGFFQDAMTLLILAFVYQVIGTFVCTILGARLGGIIVYAPLAGALLRFRINYTPRPTQSDIESGEQDDSSTTEDVYKVRNYLHMLKEVYTIERWSGLFRGMVPKLVVFYSSKLLCLVPFIPCVEPWMWTNRIIALAPNRLTFPAYLLAALVPLALEVALLLFTNRAITARTTLGFCTHPIRAVRALFTTQERARISPRLAIPRVVVSPQVRGMFVTALLRTVYVAFVYTPLSTLILSAPHMNTPGTGEPLDIPRIAGSLTLSVSLFVLSVMLITPFEVAAARLSVVYPTQYAEDEAEKDNECEGTEVEVQKVQGSVDVEVFVNEKEKHIDADAEVVESLQRNDVAKSPEVNEVIVQAQETIPAVSQEVVPVDSPESTKAAVQAQAFRLRHEPYAGLVPCMREILAEEGRSALWRTWWVTGFGLLYTAARY